MGPAIRKAERLEGAVTLLCALRVGSFNVMQKGLPRLEECVQTVYRYWGCLSVIGAGEARVRKQ